MSKFFVKVTFCSKSERGADMIAGEQTWTNTFFNLDKYILQFGEIHFVANLKVAPM